MDSLPSTHFLATQRPDLSFSQPIPAGQVDTSTLAAHDFDVDTRTGFLPPAAPLKRLPATWEAWEMRLDESKGGRFILGDSLDITLEQMNDSERWRKRVQELPILPIAPLTFSELLLRRSHHVLSFILHIYIHTLPPTSPIHIPPSLSLPLLRICEQLHLPPVNTYTDNVLYNWSLIEETKSGLPTLKNLQCQTTFTGTNDEDIFFLSSTRIELRGVEALSLMGATMDEAFVGDSIAFRRITTYLNTMAGVIQDMKDLLLGVQEGCNPTVFYELIRPWFRGADSDPAKRPWVFEGIEGQPELEAWTKELSGPSAGQSPLIHALDIFLGVNAFTHGHGSSTSSNEKTFLTRMQTYMSRHHRAFLTHLSTKNPRPLRALVLASEDAALMEAYNCAVCALKEFRDAHMIVVGMYIVRPARKGITAQSEGGNKALKGTGGTDLVQFLKAVRDKTARAIMDGGTEA